MITYVHWSLSSFTRNFRYKRNKKHPEIAQRNTPSTKKAVTSVRLTQLCANSTWILFVVTNLLGQVLYHGIAKKRLQPKTAWIWWYFTQCPQHFYDKLRHFTDFPTNTLQIYKPMQPRMQYLLWVRRLDPKVLADVEPRGDFFTSPAEFMMETNSNFSCSFATLSVR